MRLFNWGNHYRPLFAATFIRDNPLLEKKCKLGLAQSSPNSFDIAGRVEREPTRFFSCLRRFG
jgi:hypothetical protein